jgi:hypothetical protein
MKQPEQLILPLAPPPDLTEVFRRVFFRLRIKSPVVSIGARFHPFAGLRSTISVRDGAVKARVSDLLAEASPLVLEALAEILLARIFRRRPSREARECYLAYTFRPAIRNRIDEARRERGTKRLLPPLLPRPDSSVAPRLEPSAFSPHSGPLRFRSRDDHRQPQTRLPFSSALSGRIRRLS